jgi:hypothetical protein
VESRKEKTVGYWAYSGLAVGMALLGFVILLGPYGFGLVLAVLGACVWVGVIGKWPGTGRRVNPVVRAVLSLIAIAANGVVAVGYGFLVVSFGDVNPVAVAGMGLGVFVGAALLEVVALLLVVGAVKLVRHFWQRARYTYASKGPERARRACGVP